MRKKERQAAVEKLALIPDGEPRVLLATGSYIGEGFDDSRFGHFVLNHAYLLARHAAAVRRTAAPDPSRKEGCPSVRLRRCTGSNACADV